ncbi:MAG: hypothetical protein ACP5XB_10520 [Isosphaeraceae bacterium]
MIEAKEQDREAISYSLVNCLHDTPSPSSIPANPDPSAWKVGLVRELSQSAIRRRLAVGLAGVGCIHLATFTICQSIFDPAIHRDLRHPALWCLELFVVLALLRVTLGRGWSRSSTAINLVAKFWTTFLILSFNLVTLNSITGFDLAWYRPAFATLSTFFFASLAWLFTPWFLVPAVQMWATGLLMSNLPEWAFLIYGVSWWIALTGIALWIRRNDRLTEVSKSDSQTGWGENASIRDLA